MLKGAHSAMTSPSSPPWAPDAGHAQGAAVTGTAGYPVNVSARISNGLDAFTIAGIPETAAAAARDRIRAAVISSGLAWPSRAITVSLEPAGLPQHGCGLDLPVAVAVLTASGIIPAGATAPCVLIAELGLDGGLRPVRGVLPAVAAAARAGCTVAVVAPANAAEAAMVPGVAVVPGPSLRAVLTWLRASSLPAQPAAPAAAMAARCAGRLTAAPALRQALQASAAGGHHLCLTGPDTAAIPELAAGLAMLLPALDPGEAMQVSEIHSVAGLLGSADSLITRPPWRSPHHTATLPAILGGGSGVTRPGEAPLAHHGVLFLDNAPEFARDILAALRQPLGSGHVVVARAGVTTQFPARFTLIAGMAPCPCGARPGCACSQLQARRYRARLASELGSYLSLWLTVRPTGPAPRRRPEPDLWAAHVADARDRARHRLRDTPWRLNGQVPGAQLARCWHPGTDASAAISRAAHAGQVSRRAAGQVISVAWTLADLAGKARPGAEECALALAFQLGTAS